jgi:serine/threonine-protein kinase
VTTAGAVKLMDFGITKAEDSALTRPGFTLGTPYYMAPEQIRGQTLTHLVDVYAFGVLLFELMTGARPVDGDMIERIFYEILVKPLDLRPLDESGTPRR